MHLLHAAPPAVQACVSTASPATHHLRARIPSTPSSRLCAPDAQPPALSSAFPTSPIPAPPVPAPGSDHGSPASGKAPDTVLYLAYGSNLCAQTFLRTRGIRPLSALNVSAPSLRLTFDLPWLPYLEPCAANVALRRVPKPPPVPVPSPPFPIPNPPRHPPIFTKEQATEEQAEPARSGDPTWTRGLIGVVYEVTRADYATIIATEGGGSNYFEILAPCVPLTPPTGGSSPFPRPFLARTLYAPRLPGVPNDDDFGHVERPSLPGWARRLLRRPHRPDPDYAQPSARYLALLVAGAAEHRLPAEYQAYLRALRPYTMTSRRQALGRVLFAGFWRAVVNLLHAVAPWCADKRTGRTAPWFGAVVIVVLNLIWLSYDGVARTVFGDGERTVEEGEGARGVQWARGKGLDEEKGELLRDVV